MKSYLKAKTTHTKKKLADIKKQESSRQSREFWKELFGDVYQDMDKLTIVNNK